MERPDPHEQGAPLAPPTSSSPAKYVPQFSAATEMILKRIQAGATPVGGGLSDMGLSGKPAGYEDMKKTVLQGMKTTYNMEITPLAKLKSATPDRRHDSPRRRSANTGNQASGGRGRGSARKGSRAGVKRKRGMRGSDESDVDESDISGLSDDSDDDGSGEEVVPTLPKTTQSGRQVVRPTQYVPAIVDGPPKKKGTKNSQEQTLCKNCARGHSPQGNQIVFCDGCNLGWHQHCHEPFIMDEVLKDEESPWFCTACNNKAGVKMTPRLDVLALTSGASQTPEQKRRYFSSLPQDQLVSLLLRTTTLHPHIPLFPSASWASRTSNASIQAYMPASLPSLTTVPILEKKANIRTQQSSQLKTPSAPSSRAESASSTSINLIRKVPPTHTPPVLPPYLTSLMMPSTPSTVLSPAVATPSPTVPHVPPTPVTHLGLRQSPLSQHTNGHVNGPITSKTPAPPSRESTPLSSVYPKAGQGLMSKLPVDDEDGEWMVDTDDYMAFSHLVYGAAGDKLEENGVALA